MVAMFDDLIQILSACADETRLRLLTLLNGDAEMCVSDLVVAMDASQPKISRHLACLKSAGLVRHRKRGLNVFYRLSTVRESPGRPLVDAILSHPTGTRPLPVEPRLPETEISVELL
jgi:ArsR family transcriptional regulator